MMRVLCYLLLVTFVCCGSNSVSAQRQGRAKGGAFASNPLAALIDENNDGVLSAREVRQAGNAIRKLDTDGDGKITEEELEAAGDDNAADDDDRASGSARPSQGRGPRPARPSSDESEAGGLKQSLEDSINQAAAFYRQKKYDNAGKAVSDAIDTLEEIQDLDELSSVTDSVKRLERAHQLLEKQGVDLPDLPQVAASTSRPAAQQTQPARSRPAAPPTEEPEAAATQGVSFTKQIAPLFIKRCAGCHIDKREGDLSLESFASLNEGSEAGLVVESGDPDNSIIVEMVQEGEMPPKGGPIPAKEIQLLFDWVDEGAKFDGENENDPIK